MFTPPIIEDLYFADLFIGTSTFFAQFGLVLEVTVYRCAYFSLLY